MCGSAHGASDTFCRGGADRVDLPSLLSGRMLFVVGAFAPFGGRTEGSVGRRYGEEEKTF
jgi:hypothetical protein